MKLFSSRTLAAFTILVICCNAQADIAKLSLSSEQKNLIKNDEVLDSEKKPLFHIKYSDIAKPVDHAFKGVITLNVDATDITRKIFWINQQIPVQHSGLITLLYPQTETASHGPSLNVANLAGLIIQADGQPVKWHRAPAIPHAFHLNIPIGTKTLEVSYQVIADSDDLMPDIVNLQWQKLILYPAGWYARNLTYTINAKLPQGLHKISALSHSTSTNDAVQLSKVSLETLLDTPLYAARYINRIALSPKNPTVMLNVMAQRTADTEVPKKRIEELTKMVAQTLLVFGREPFAKYDFMVRLTDNGYSGGSEHATSSEISGTSEYFREWGQQLNNRDIIAHEFVHAWNGLSRIPEDLWVPTPNEPQGTSLLWVYEGQTEMWGRVLAARSGLRSLQETLDQFALDAAEVSNRPGRSWRPLSDDVNYPSFMMGKRVPWQDWQRKKDYYREGVLLWLEVEAIIRAQTDGKRGLEDFTRSFFAKSVAKKTYTFESLCSDLANIAPYDWVDFFSQKLDGQNVKPTDALNKLGWALVYDEKPSETYLQNEKESGATDFSYSIGLSVTDNGKITKVNWQSPAFLSGLSSYARILSVSNEPYNNDRMISAVRNARRTPITLLVEQDGQQRTVVINYKGTLRYPKLKRLKNQRDGLSSFLAPLKSIEI
jgi:predicted metalloprotease with PDZ domain